MGRVKLAIKEIETSVGKQITYSKRHAGLEKKARELATLCDIDIVLILFSPAGKLSWTNGSRSPPEEVIMRFANLSPQERAKRKVDALEQLKRVFKKLDHEVDIEEHTQQMITAHNLEELHQQLQNLKMLCTCWQHRLRSYESFQTIQEANDLESSLEGRLQKIHLHKTLLQSSSQLVPFNQGLGEQIYQEGLLNSCVIDASNQASWEVDHRHSMVALQNQYNPSFSLRDANDTSDCTVGLQANMIQCGKHMDSSMHGCGIHMYNGLKRNGDPDENNKARVGSESEGNCISSVERIENRDSLTNSVLDGNRFPSQWSIISNAISRIEMKVAEPTRYAFLQQTPFELEDSSNGCSLDKQSEFFGPQNNSEAMNSMQGWYRYAYRM